MTASGAFEERCSRCGSSRPSDRVGRRGEPDEQEPVGSLAVGSLAVGSLVRRPGIGRMSAAPKASRPRPKRSGSTDQLDSTIWSVGVAARDPSDLCRGASGATLVRTDGAPESAILVSYEAYDHAPHASAAAHPLRCGTPVVWPGTARRSRNVAAPGRDGSRRSPSPAVRSFSRSPTCHHPERFSSAPVSRNLPWWSPTRPSNG